MTSKHRARIEQHPEYKMIVQFAHDGPMVSSLRWFLISVSAIVFLSLLYFAPVMSPLAAVPFSVFFLLPVLFGKSRQFARRALRALDRRRPVAAQLTFEDYDSDWCAQFTLRSEAGKTWRVRMAQSNDKIDALAKTREHAVTAYLDAATGTPAAVCLGELILWQFEAERR